MSNPASNQHNDDVAVDQFAAAMKAKLAKKRAEGRGGWDDPTQCDVEYLALLLANHVSKGDPVDVGNLAMMLFHRDGRAALIEVAARCIRTSDEGTPEELVRLRAEIGKLRRAVETTSDDHQSGTIKSLCDRLDFINNICHDAVMQDDEKVRQIEEWSAGFMPVPGSTENGKGSL